MAGLLIRELELRGLAERILIVCPANLAFQWQRELKEKFDEKFLVIKGQDIRDQFGMNQWMEQKRVITSATKVHWPATSCSRTCTSIARATAPSVPPSRTYLFLNSLARKVQFRLGRRAVSQDLMWNPD
jgi:hypothetical protein